MTIKSAPIRVVLAMSTVFACGDVWWCEDCGAGGFAGREARHRIACDMRRFEQFPRKEIER
jgi:hypothetical protein